MGQCSVAFAALSGSGMEHLVWLGAGALEGTQQR